MSVYNKNVFLLGNGLFPYYVQLFEYRTNKVRMKITICKNILHLRKGFAWKVMYKNMCRDHSFCLLFQVTAGICSYGDSSEFSLFFF